MKLFLINIIIYIYVLVYLKLDRFHHLFQMNFIFILRDDCNKAIYELKKNC